MKSLAAILTLLAILIFLHLSAIHFYFYWTIWWFDIAMHVLGGFVAGYAMIAAVGGRASQPVLLANVLAAALVLGLVWEVYEHIAGMTFVAAHSYVIDTASDLMSDAVGAMLAFLLIKKSAPEISHVEQS